MAKRTTKAGEPYVGMRLFLGGEVTRVEEESGGVQRVTVTLDTYSYPITIIWREPDGASIATE
jgi:hypothetical protein